MTLTGFLQIEIKAQMTLMNLDSEYVLIKLHLGIKSC